MPVTEAPTEDSEGPLTFTDPNLGFSVAAAEDHSLVVHLSLESVAGRPGADEEAPHAFYAHSVPLRMGREDLRAAAGAWEDDLTPFPER